jgi:DUF4097 and DUF4098 domain-containing protein YvlB
VTLANGPLDIEQAAGAIKVQLANGPVHIQRCSGAIEARVSNGPVRVEKAAGTLVLRVHNGPIDLVDLTSSIEAQVSNGPIRYRGAIGGDFDMRVRRGSIVLDLPDDARFELDAEAERGTVHCEFAVNDSAAPGAERAPRVLLRSERGEIRLRQASNALSYS